MHGCIGLQSPNSAATETRFWVGNFHILCRTIGVKGALLAVPGAPAVVRLTVCVSCAGACTLAFTHIRIVFARVRSAVRKALPREPNVLVPYIRRGRCCRSVVISMALNNKPETTSYKRQAGRMELLLQ